MLLNRQVLLRLNDFFDQAPNPSALLTVIELLLFDNDFIIEDVFCQLPR